MKSFLLALALSSVIGPSMAKAQPYAIKGLTCTAAGTVRGGTYQIIGTIGQPEAAPRLAARCISVAPGFWGAYVEVSTPDAPTLHIRQLDANYIRVSFTPGCHDWVLQWTRTLNSLPAATIWTDDLASNLIDLGDERARDFHVPSWGPLLFFRLRPL